MYCMLQTLGCCFIHLMIHHRIFYLIFKLIFVLNRHKDISLFEIEFISSDKESHDYKLSKHIHGFTFVK